jgi:polar amino acid transport system substrate-binding protein
VGFSARFGVWIFSLALVLAAAAPIRGLAQTEAPKLRVATRVVAPFVMREGDHLTGFSIDLWNALAEEAGFQFSYTEVQTLPELVDSVRTGKADLAISAISITADRAKSFDFSQPIFNAGVQIMTRAKDAGGDSLVPGFLAFFTSRPFFQLMGALVALIVVPAPLIWWLERRFEQGSIAASTRVGEFFKSMFWSATTVIGQTSGHPLSAPGRIIALIWMVTSVTYISYFTAFITSALTVQQLQSGINGVDDLAGKRVGTVAGSSSADFLAKSGVVATPYADVGKAIDELFALQIDAIVYDAPVLLYYAAHEGNGRVRLVGALLHPEDYGVLFPIGSPYRKPVDEALLRLRESGGYQRITQHWFKPARAE